MPRTWSIVFSLLLALCKIHVATTTNPNWNKSRFLELELDSRLFTRRYNSNTAKTTHRREWLMCTDVNWQLLRTILLFWGVCWYGFEKVFWVWLFGAYVSMRIYQWLKTNHDVRMLTSTMLRLSQSWLLYRMYTNNCTLTTSPINVSFEVQNSGYIKVDLTLQRSEHKTPSSTGTGSTGTPLTFSVNIYIQHLGVQIMRILP